MKGNPADAVFFDSNIFIYAEAREEKQHQDAKSRRDRVLEGDFDACVSPQVLSEVFSSVTYQGRKGAEQPLPLQSRSTDWVERPCRQGRAPVPTGRAVFPHPASP